MRRVEPEPLSLTGIAPGLMITGSHLKGQAECPGVEGDGSAECDRRVLARHVDHRRRLVGNAELVRRAGCAERDNRGEHATVCDPLLERIHDRGKGR